MGYDEMKSVLNNPTLTKMIRLIPKPESFWGLRIVPDKGVTSDIAVWIEISGGLRMAEIVHPDSPAYIVTSDRQYKEKMASFFHIREKMPLKESELKNLRDPETVEGEGISYGEKYVAEKQEELNSRIDMRKEWSIWQMLQGSLTYSYEGVTFSVDYGIRAEHKITLTGGDKWDDETTANPQKQFQTAKKLIKRNGSAICKYAFMNTTTAEYLKNNEKIRQLLQYTDGRKLVEEDTIGKVSGVEVVEYDGYYMDRSGNLQNFIPDGKVIFVAGDQAGEPMARFLQSRSLDPNGKFRTPGKYSESWVEKDPRRVWLCAGLIGLPVLYHKDWVVVMTVF